MENTIISLYALIPFLASAAHIPQLRKAIISTPEELKGVSFMAWGVWWSCSLISLFYGLFHLGDIYFIIVSSVTLFWNSVFISLMSYKIYFKRVDSDAQYIPAE
ncbi:MAG: hypothetical protein JKY11_08320 [Alphaproteobacteria bacterium]|nr:hypothetical protein [Alphaproteobacteria bacterium]